VGAERYFEDPDTHVICVAWCIDRGPIEVWCPSEPTPSAILNFTGTIVAHNWLFEFAAWEFLGWPQVPIDRWDCTMARALYHGLPAGLDALGEALNLAIKKDAGARSLMLRMARPRAPGPVWWHETDPAKLKALIDYCRQDVAVERLLDQVLPPLPPRERDVFQVDGRINRRGLRIDTVLVDRMDTLIGQEVHRLDAELSVVTDAQVRTTNQVAKLQDWLHRDQGVEVAKLDRDTVAEALHQVPNDRPLARRALQLRQEAARSSTKKLRAMTQGLSWDGRLRGLFQYGGAGRTLRWAGRRVQPQNFPRGTIKAPNAAIGLIDQGIHPEDLNLLFEDSPMGCIASCLRGCFVAEPGRVLVVGDLAQIEARVVAWLAGQRDVLDIFASGQDVYSYTAGRLGSSSRQLGKVLCLAAGFGMGWQRFQHTAQKYGLVLSEGAAREAVEGWRASNDQIVDFWFRLGDAVIRAIRDPREHPEAVGLVTVRRTKLAIRIVLPSGRELIYHQVAVEDDELGRPNPVFMGSHPITKQWAKVRTYGGKLVENVVQAVARDVLADAMVVLDRLGAELVATVHDELIEEADTAIGDQVLDRMLTAMRATPAWAPGLPVHAEGWIGVRYGKS
jgi:DNA polymerase